MAGPTASRAFVSVRAWFLFFRVVCFLGVPCVCGSKRSYHRRDRSFYSVHPPQAQKVPEVQLQITYLYRNAPSQKSGNQSKQSKK
eukprot:2594069-Amphidinium_carterae.1